MSSDISTLARTISQEFDVPVFPVQSNKRPVWSVAECKRFGWDKNGKAGHHIASKSPAVIKSQFAHADATGVGVPMGKVSGLICFDLDYGRGYDDKLDAWADDWHDQLLFARQPDVVTRTQKGRITI